MDVNLDLVPMREEDMSAYELMLSESQERMLAVAHKGREQEVLDVFRKWGLKAEVIGYVREHGETVVTRHGQTSVHLDAKLLTDYCPTYTPEIQIPAYFARAKKFDPESLKPSDPKGALLQLLASPNIASKRWVFEQYDQSVQTQTALLPGNGDAAVIAPRGTKKGLALKIDGNGRHVYFDPFVGGQLAVCEAARNVACTGARPVAVTDGLNYGNPQKPHVYWQFKESVRGIAEACEVMQTPVISGNVSFYNESDLGEVLPTPLIGMLGILENAGARIGMALTKECDLALISTPILIRQEGLGASEFLAVIHSIEDGCPEAPDVELERRLCSFLADEVGAGNLLAAHDCSDGGLAVALAEMCIAGGSGVAAEVPAAGPSRLDAKLFGELPGRVIVAYEADLEARLRSQAEVSGLRFERLGVAHPSSDVFKLGTELTASVRQLQDAFENAIADQMRG